jgi:quercetin dioxygenase-like cupin family protein
MDLSVNPLGLYRRWEGVRMPLHRNRIGPALAFWYAAAAACRPAPAGTRAAAQGDSTGQSRPVLSHSLPRLDGTRLVVTVVEVIYRPGESSPPHSHPCPVIGYVLEGAVRSQVQGEPEAIYRAGESFYEAPGGTHLVSANASRKVPARFLAYFTCDRDTPLSVPPPARPR